jgi:hypothetical protein
VAGIGGARMRGAASRANEASRADGAWFAVELLDMRAGVDKALARVVNVFGCPPMPEPGYRLGPDHPSDILSLVLTFSLNDVDQYVVNRATVPGGASVCDICIAISQRWMLD